MLFGGVEPFFTKMLKEMPFLLLVVDDPRMVRSAEVGRMDGTMLALPTHRPVNRMDSLSRYLRHKPVYLFDKGGQLLNQSKFYTSHSWLWYVLEKIFPCSVYSYFRWTRNPSLKVQEMKRVAEMSVADVIREIGERVEETHYVVLVDSTIGGSLYLNIWKRPSGRRTVLSLMEKGV